MIKPLRSHDLREGDSLLLEARAQGQYFLPIYQTAYNTAHVTANDLILPQLKMLRLTDKQCDAGSPSPRARIELSRGEGGRILLDSTVLEGEDGTIIVSYHIPEVPYYYYFICDTTTTHFI